MEQKALDIYYSAKIKYNLLCCNTFTLTYKYRRDWYLFLSHQQLTFIL